MLRRMAGSAGDDGLNGAGSNRELLLQLAADVAAVARTVERVDEEGERLDAKVDATRRSWQRCGPSTANKTRSWSASYASCRARRRTESTTPSDWRSWNAPKGCNHRNVAPQAVGLQRRR